MQASKFYFRILLFIPITFGTLLISQVSQAQTTLNKYPVTLPTVNDSQTRGSATDVHITFYGIPTKTTGQGWTNSSVIGNTLNLWGGNSIGPGNSFELSAIINEARIVNTPIITNIAWSNNGKEDGGVFLTYNAEDNLGEKYLINNGISRIVGVPEPSSVPGTLAFGLLCTGVILKRKLKQKKLVGKTQNF
jgi:hypothetical protein